jgi:hypothetical protein
MMPLSLLFKFFLRFQDYRLMTNKDPGNEHEYL